MPVAALGLIALICTLFSFLLLAILSPDAREIKRSHFVGFYISLPAILLWFIIFAATEKKYDTKIYSSVTVDGRDGFFDDRGEFHNINGMFGRRFEPGTEIEGKWETPRYGLTWGEGTTYSVKGQDGSDNSKD